MVAAIRKVMIGAACQGCRVHFLRNVFQVLPRDAGSGVCPARTELRAWGRSPRRSARSSPRPARARSGRRSTRSPTGSAASSRGAGDAAGGQGRLGRLRRIPGKTLEEDSVDGPS
ncbi:transposase [Streptomyces sp. NPDC002795]|uniref:transposase n=1 Tax=Streptomyces sp. NPDC002795 TaxID=3364665 RepID=UPI0036CC88F9